MEGGDDGDLPADEVGEAHDDARCEDRISCSEGLGGVEEGGRHAFQLRLQDDGDDDSINGNGLAENHAASQSGSNG